jgi:pimeloyl-ACP methyl ester carboxylesterase
MDHRGGCDCCDTCQGRVKQGMYVALAAVATIYAGICLAMFVFQRSLLYYPQPRAVTAPESTLALHVPGADLVVTVRPHSGPKAIIYFGGNGEDVSANLASFAQAFPDHALFLLHYRGYGGSTGRPSEQAISSDAIALFKHVYAKHTDVVVIGRSLGSGVAIRLASETPASRLILVTPYDSIEAIAAAEYPYVPVKLLLLDRYESWKYAPGMAIPTTIIAAQNDEVIPRASTEKLFARFRPGVAAMRVIEGVGHNDIGANGEYLKAIQAALL